MLFTLCCNMIYIKCLWWQNTWPVFYEKENSEAALELVSVELKQCEFRRTTNSHFRYSVQNIDGVPTSNPEPTAAPAPAPVQAPPPTPAVQAPAQKVLQLIIHRLYSQPATYNFTLMTLEIAGVGRFSYRPTLIFYRIDVLKFLWYTWILDRFQN